MAPKVVACDFVAKPADKFFKTHYMYRAYEPGVKEQLVDIALNGSGNRDTARVLGVGKNTVIARIKDKTAEVAPVYPHIVSQTLTVEIRHLIDPRMNVIQNPAYPSTGSQQTASGRLGVVHHNRLTTRCARCLLIGYD